MDVGSHRLTKAGHDNEPIMIETAAQKMVEEMIASGRYHAILWADDYGPHLLYSQSDTDSYATATDAWPGHWYMERVDGRRIELTVYTLDQWHQILSEPQAPLHLREREGAL